MHIDKRSQRASTEVSTTDGVWRGVGRERLNRAILKHQQSSLKGAHAGTPMPPPSQPASRNSSLSRAVRPGIAQSIKVKAWFYRRLMEKKDDRTWSVVWILDYDASEFNPQ
jgi:hypothetical protein